jgi:hypothetical protein
MATRPSNLIAMLFCILLSLVMPGLDPGIYQKLGKF